MSVTTTATVAPASRRRLIDRQPQSYLKQLVDRFGFTPDALARIAREDARRA